MSTDGTQINAYLAETRANIEQASSEKKAMAQQLIERGASDISTESRIETIGNAACELIDNLERGEYTTAIRIHINPAGAGGYIPGTGVIGDALDGAYVLLEESGSSNKWRIPITSIEDATVVFDNTFTRETTTLIASVILGISGEDIRSKRVATIISNSASVDITVTTYLADENTFEIGRVFPIDANDASSYLITATTAGGVRTELFGQFDASGVWVSDTGVTAAVPEIDPETGTVASWANGPENGDSFKNIWPWSAVKRETFTAIDAVGTETELIMSGFRKDGFYGVKVEERDIVFSTLNADGTTTSATKACRILWIARPHLNGYEIPSFFYRKEGTEMVLSNGLFLGVHKGNTKSVKATSTENVTILTTGTVGSRNSAGSVAQFYAYAQALNRLKLRDPMGETLEADATNRRFAPSNLDTYMAFWHLFVVQFGLDAQSVFQGITTDTVVQGYIGDTDPIVAAGHMTGSMGSAAGLTPFCFLGIENFGYGSEGDTLCDVSFFSGSESEEETTLETRTYVQPDRSAYLPGQGDIATLTAAGYVLLTTRDNGNTVTHLCGRSDNPLVRDMHMPTREDDGFLNAKKCDQLGGIYRTGVAAGKWVLSAACLFGHRSAGIAGGARAGVCSLGWYYAGYGPSYSNAAYFGSRVTLLL